MYYSVSLLHYDMLFQQIVREKGGGREGEGEEIHVYCVHPCSIHNFFLSLLATCIIVNFSLSPSPLNLPVLQLPVL